jgi:hypothetical protein
VDHGELPRGVRSVNKGGGCISSKLSCFIPSFAWFFGLPARDSFEMGGQLGISFSGRELAYRWGWQFWREGVPWVAQRV